MENNNKKNAQNNGTNGTNGNQTEKVSLIDRGRKAFDKFRASKAGKRTIKAVKIIGGAALTIAAYKTGQRHPVIKLEPEPEQQKLEAPIEETPTEEAPAAEPAVEEETI